ncbi:di-trans,poly-cis-decaprenylcistransferase [Thermoanaerobacterium thermosaccharolyticum]|uniref:Di-trans-poly-cis-decaprenylcistransferase n=2 Tax=Thermoanaerobacterium thermosaccharolyticum TaxID=1517 RepID=D9TPT5_THETC|nr:polyprenyl diphosphate synthase [Thermoanaerobacterium thermosaccharolyticum]ADL68767.1 Di-trans-poly-cis-decaprenylcistransferase [Thermoanaerobacterium thermosaccharolyticum DSM 571]TCW37313.1 undecaprenyl diphosphate synthase [Thermohydrogenium kirishiense]AST59197.1 dihydroorotate dehydrogenase [Thermoanaerobacterium thermosaccharolyticum]KAA5807580.1 di-trans,poly-cis-decaprenylcistransferase [Thermoanaerobacterium thermosaccharolyticum]MBE0067912.1 di-trans,poly-cis-decaprenylcistrans
MYRIPNHIGIIPDGNRRWAQNKNMPKEAGYSYGLEPGIALYRLCRELGVKELTFYGFTQDNTKRPSVQTEAFKKACIDAVKMLEKEDADLLVIGNYNSPMFPKELLPYLSRKTIGEGKMKVNFLVNYGWQWDLNSALKALSNGEKRDILDLISSKDISRIDLIIRWGGRRRLSGFLPVQSIYSDFYVIDDYWPDFKPQHLYEALEWYSKQDITLGG